MKLADWDHQHVRTLIDAALVMAGQSPMGPENGLAASARPPEIDPALAVVARFRAAD
jgi:hypothetical protein